MSLPAGEEGVSAQHPCQQEVNGCKYFQHALNWLGIPLLHYWGAGLVMGSGEKGIEQKGIRNTKKGSGCWIICMWQKKRDKF